MADTAPAGRARLWALRAVYTLAMLALVLFRLLPLETTPHRWAGPDLALTLTYVWALRRPELVPAPLVAGLFFLSDLLLDRPPALMALLVLLVTERLKRRQRAMRDLPFAVEWLTAGVACAVTLLGYRMVQAVFLIDQAQLSLTLWQLGWTILMYPVVVGISALFLGLRKAAPGEVDALGHRL